MIIGVLQKPKSSHRGLQSLPLPIPHANGLCPFRLLPASMVRRNGTCSHHLVVRGRLWVQRWQCQACLGRASPLPSAVTSRQHPQTFRERVTNLFGVWAQRSLPGPVPDPGLAGLRGGGCQAVARRAGRPGLDWGDWFQHLVQCGVRGMTTDDDSI